MPFIKRTFILCLLLLFSPTIFAQKYGQPLIDSLQGELIKAKEDSNKVSLLTRISDYYYYNFDTSLYYAKKAGSLAEKLDWEKGIASTSRAIGDAYYLHYDFPVALQYYFSSLKIFEAENDRENEINVLYQLAQLYNSSRDYARSIEYASKVLKLEETTGNDINIFNGLFLIEGVYENMNNYPLALEYLFKVLNIYKKNNDKNGVEYTEQRIGDIFFRTRDYPKALEHSSLSAKLSEASGDTQNTKKALLQIASILSHQGNDSTAIEFCNKAIRLDSYSFNKNGVANDYYQLIDVYLKLHDYFKALEYGFKILKNCEQNDTANIKYALGKIGITYYRIAKDSTAHIMSNKLIPSGKTANLLKAKEYFTRSGICNARTIFSKNSSTTETANLYPQLIETQQLLGDYKGAFENLKAAKALDDTLTSKMKKGLVSSLEMKQSSDEAEKQMAIDKIAKAKKRNEQVFYFVGIGLLLLVVVVIYRNFLAQKKSNKIITKEKKRSDDLLLNILPSEVAEELKEKGSAAAKYFDHVTVLFTDFVGFTKAGERMSPQQLVDELDVCFKEFDGIIEKYGIEKIKTIGDAYLAVSGLPAENSSHAENIVNAAMDIRDFMLQRRQQHGDKTFEVRIGIHSGSVVAGIVGVKKFAYDIWGDTVNTAARMEQNSEGGKVNISQATYELVKDKFVCTYRGDIDAKNKGEMSMYFVEKTNKG